MPIRFLLLLLFVPFFFFVSFLMAADWATLEKNFTEPPHSSKSRPLWFWNKIPTAEETRAQIKAAAESGYAGLGILPAFPQDKMKFMSPEFLEQYKIAADTAGEFGLKLCLYDEYWFPSGSAGGLLREKHPEHLCKRVDMLEATPDADGKATLELPKGTLMGCVAMNMKTFARQNITSSVNDGVLHWQRPAGDPEPYKVMAFVCILDGQRNLVDYLEPQSVRVFVELTYATYQRAMPEHFGTTIDSAFYDEPMFYTPADGRAWTPRFNEYFEKRFGYDPVPLYPAMFMDIGPDTASARNALFGFRSTLFSEGFVKTITDWLEPYGMPLTGHLDEEEVVNPTGMSGDVIKFFKYQPIPGLDQIYHYGRASTTYKLVSSAATNYDRHLVMSEVYGAMTNMPPENLYKEVLDQSVKGVNMFVPHAVWYDADPQAVVFQPELSYRTQPYADELPRYNEYVGRLHTLLQQPGPTVVDVAVLYPIESLQATYYFGGPLSAYAGGVPGLEDNYMRVGEHLSFAARRDFFYVHPEILRQRCSVVPKDGKFPPLLRLNNTDNPVDFRVLIIPSMEVIGLETLRRVHEFHQAGGTVIAVGRLPSGAAERNKDGEVLALLEEIFGKEALEKSAENRRIKPVVIEASSEWAGGGHPAQLAFDGKIGTRWNSASGGENGQWLKVVFPETVEISKIVLSEPFDRVSKVQIQTLDAGGNDWVTQAAGGPINRRRIMTFPAVKTRELRILFDHPGQDTISISEVDVFDAADRSVLHGSASLTTHSLPSGGSGIVVHCHPTLSLDRFHDLLQAALGNGEVRFINENSLPIGSPTGAFMYLHRIIHGRDVYFFSNSTSESVETTALLNGKPRRFAWWNPRDGSRVEIEGKYSDGNTAIPLKLGPVESLFLIGTPK